ncbi:hypothetical protein [Actinomyces bowdenii]|uniref:hypothetical protein n=1 Tax=Actinomyces bowdenii TaxID=131109 RepID=UPI0035A357E7
MTRNGVMTVAQLELRQRVRSTRWRIMLLIWALVLLLVCGGLTLLTLSTDEPLRSTTPWLYDTIVCFVMGIGLIVAPAVRDTQEVTVHTRSPSPHPPGSPEDEGTVQCTQRVETEEIYRMERIWWLLAPNPFIILSDISVRYGGAQPTYSPDSPLAAIGEEVDAMLTPEPASETEDYCTYSELDSVPPEDSRAPSPAHLAFWPASLLLLALLGAGAASAATRRLAVPATALPRGIRWPEGRTAARRARRTSTTATVVGGGRLSPPPAGAPRRHGPG